MRSHLGEPIGTGKPAATTPAPFPERTASNGSEGDETILALYKRNRIVGKDAYETLRQIYSTRFEQKYAAEIRQAFGDRYDEMTKWLDGHRDLKEEFYTAIDQEHDNVPAARAVR